MNLGLQMWTLGEFSEMFTNSLLILGILLIISSMLMGMRKRKKKAADRVTAHEHLDRLKNKHAVKNDLESLMVEIEELGKRLSHQIDAKTIALERLLDEAELRIAQLNQLAQSQTIQQQNGMEQTNAQGNQMPPAEMNPPTAATEPAPMLTRNDVIQTDHDQIYRLADAGQNASQIAQATGEHIGKIELILALRRTS